MAALDKGRIREIIADELIGFHLDEDEPRLELTSTADAAADHLTAEAPDLDDLVAKYVRTPREDTVPAKPRRIVRNTTLATAVRDEGRGDNAAPKRRGVVLSNKGHVVASEG